MAQKLAQEHGLEWRHLSREEKDKHREQARLELRGGSAPRARHVTYQSFAPGQGGSDSLGKLAALKLPELTGKTVLDLGCNEGFFSFAALEKGAAFVTGIDRNAEHIASANRRAAELGAEEKTKFVHGSWDEAPDGPFDVASLFSALHYASDQPAFIAKIANLLNPGGLLILEAGVADSEEAWSTVKRGNKPGKGIVQYPNRPTMMWMLRSHFAARRVGSSVPQRGDPVPRYVFHCNKIMQTILCIEGNPGTGKTTLAKFFEAKGIPTLACDAFYMSLVEGTGPCSDLARKYFQDSLGLTYKALANAGDSRPFAEAFADQIQTRFPQENVVAAEGFLFSQRPFIEAFQEVCQERALVFWMARPQLPIR